MSIKEYVKSHHEEMVAWRRDFHMHPELGFQEFRTSKKILEILQTMDIDKIIHNFCKTAIIAVIKGKRPGPVLGLRADIDALAMQDEKDVEYKSQNPGVCHACGHDVHTAIGLGIAKYYSSHKDELNGMIKIVFQPAEEGPAPGGAKLIVETGKLGRLDYMIGFHANPEHPVGTVWLRRNEMQASADNFDIVVNGVGGHGAYPHQTTDVMRTIIQIYETLQTMITREVDPVKAVLLSICYLNTGSNQGPNIIPHIANMGGTFRTFDNNLRDFMVKRINEIVDSICKLNGCTYKLNIVPGSIALSNDDKLVDIYEEVANEVLGAENVNYITVPEMGYDDFAYYKKVSKQIAYFYFGTTNERDLGKFTFHEPNFDVDEECLCVGTELLINIINKLLK